jgi:hypothetical protein
MSTPNDIVTLIETRLKLIQTADGYSSDLGSQVYRWLQKPLASDLLPAVEIRDPSDQAIDTVGGGPTYTDWQKRVELRIVVKEGSASDTAIRAMFADCWKALTTDAADEDFGGLVHYITPESHEIITGDQDERIILGGIITFTVTYRTRQFTDTLVEGT